jgi:hypothetical protein
MIVIVIVVVVVVVMGHRPNLFAKGRAMGPTCDGDWPLSTDAGKGELASP